ncbi:hypothetical protein GIB67_006953 [Kingdonia uniflora]|uniref:Peptidase M14 domain-containing protein n=1 Tax=Kingdonia uniflora TaxID=39325 RepID=A0A7J7NZD2_9MAGN|nr:hypothetical protein GIB67_006953 [Kingdonia uniflora]
MIPKHSFSQEISSYLISTVPEKFYDKVEEGSIILKKSKSLSFCKNGLRIDGQVEPLETDIVILGTGYKGDEKFKNIFTSRTLQKYIMGSASTTVSLYSEALIEEISDLVGRHPDRLTMGTFRTKNKGYHAEISVVTYARSTREMDNRSKFRILLSFGQHGRELITTELALRLLSILSDEQSMPNMDSKTMNDILEKLVIKVVPMENGNGRKLVEEGELCERRNGRGVDLNRNWSVDWGKKEKDYDPYEENPGAGPFSEPETQIMRKLSKSFNPHIWVNVHSGMEALFMPYDHRNTTPNGLASHIMKSMLNDLNHLHCEGQCVVGSGGGSVGYLAHGTATDYMYDVLKVPMAFTFEIYGDMEASSRDCFRMFNPVDLTTFNVPKI